VAGAVAGVELSPAGTVERCALALFGLGAVPVRARSAEAAVTGEAVAAVSPDEVGRMAVADAGAPPEDLHAAPAHRLRIGAAMAAKAWSEALGEAQRSGPRSAAGVGA